VQVIIGIITGLLVTAIWAIGSFLFRRKNPIVVSPRSFRILRRRDWEARFRFSIHNRLHETFYSIIVKLTIRQSGIQSDNFAVDPAWERQPQEKRINSISVRTDIFRIDGRDSQDREAIFLFISSIFPKETLSFILTSQPSEISAAGEQVPVSLEVVDFRREPSEILEGPQGLALPFIPEENISVRRIRLLMRR